MASRRGFPNEMYSDNATNLKAADKELKQLRTSDTVNRSHNVSLPMILKKIKVGQLLQSSCISSLLVPIL